MKEATRAPAYAVALYPKLCELFRENGYALAVHGTLARDMDIAAIAWIDEPSSPQVVVDKILKKFSGFEQIGEPQIKPRNRLVYTISVGFGDSFLDLTFI